MKKLACALFGLSLIVALQVATGSSPAAPAPGKKVFVIAGQVSKDGAILVNDEINRWTVANTASLSGYEGMYVTVLCHVDADNHILHILSVSRSQPVKANFGDSAFRR